MRKSLPLQNNDHDFNIPSTMYSSIQTPKNNQKSKKLQTSSKRKLILSPSKDLIIFFGQNNTSKFNSINLLENKVKCSKLTLQRKKQEKQPIMQQNNFMKQSMKEKRILSATTSAQSINSKKDSHSDQQRFLKLKKQVDQIRRKYSLNKLSKHKSLSHINSSQVLRYSASSTVHNSLNTSKDMYLTPKPERKIVKKILTKNVFTEKPHYLQLNEKNNFTRTLKLDSKKNQQESIRKNSELCNLSNSVDLKSEIQNSDERKTFMFTFGSMAMMDFQSKQNLKLKIN